MNPLGFFFLILSLIKKNYKENEFLKKYEKYNGKKIYEKSMVPCPISLNR